MSFDEFQNRARLYVIGALEPEETESFEEARKEYAQKAEDFIAQCYDLHEAFALSLRPEKSSDALKQRLMAMVRERKTH
jgi:superoxide dismutase